MARLATVGSDGGPHLVPIVFVLLDDVVWSAVDGKPKSTRALRRLANIRSDPRVSLLVDHYGDDWSQLWWVRLDGLARVVDLHAPQDRDSDEALDAATVATALTALAALTEKYEQYRSDPPVGPLVRITATRWVSWSHGPAT